MPLERLPPVDEHAVLVAAPPEAVYDAVLAILATTFGTGRARLVAGLLGCDPPSTAAWRRPAVGSSVPGFRVVAADRPGLLVVAGRHRFSRYGIVFRVQPAGRWVRVRAETRAAFPGPHGAAYRLAVIGSGGHAVTVRRMLRRIARVAERAPPR
ncbi:hypothetical protein OF117_07100 [Geodermatophilus sp. YIM 151500]|uniref:hypothetical protein n=1 Tax=Geodermatophilus sp. YIM 151500 TaxID=2984531 RepID=UPI0021E478D2|nr:hypothetical protein [Geodermatophilus sp. YIM 151500]MCV2489127.1 hypothetical protein [Geodermatophilus sp. YIM 151500]